MPHLIELETDEQRQLLQKLFYDENMKVGRDRLYKYCRIHHPNLNLNRRQVGEWLMRQEIWQKTLKPTRKRSSTRSVVKEKTEIGYLQVDLKYAPFPTIGGYLYLMVVIDVFSRLVHIAFLKDKSQPSVTARLKSVIQDSIWLGKPHATSHVQTDRGTEFSGAFTDMLAEKRISHSRSKAYTPQSQGVIERFNGVLQAFLTRMELDQKKNYVELLPRFIEIWNKLVHSQTKMTPIELQEMSQLQKESGIQNTKLEAAIQNINRTSSFVRTEDIGKMEARFSVGNIVRIRLPAGLPNKKKGVYWSHQIYKILYKSQPTTSNLAQFTLERFDDKGATRVAQIGVYNASELLLVRSVERNPDHTLDVPETLPASRVSERMRTANAIPRQNRFTNDQGISRVDVQEDDSINLRSYLLRGKQALGSILLERFVKADNKGILDHDIISQARQLSSEIGATILYKRMGGRSIYYLDNVTAQRCGLTLPPEGARILQAANTRFVDPINGINDDE